MKTAASDIAFSRDVICSQYHGVMNVISSVVTL